MALVLGVIASCGHRSSQPAEQRAAVASPAAPTVSADAASPSPAVTESADAAATVEPSVAERMDRTNAHRAPYKPFVTRVYSVKVVSDGIEFTVGTNGTYVTQNWTGVFVLGRSVDSQELPDTKFSVRSEGTSRILCFLPNKTKLPADRVRLIPPHP